MVHEHAHQLLADRLRAQRRNNARIHATRKPKDHAVAVHLLANGRHGIVDDRVHGPVRFQPCDPKQEVCQHLLAIRRVANLRVELRGVKLSLGAFHRSHGTHVGHGCYREALGHFAHRVTMAHPHGLLVRRLAIQRRRAAATCTIHAVNTGEGSGAVFALLGMTHRTAERLRHDLLAVAKTEHGDAQLEDLGVDRRCIFGIDACRTARQDDGARILLTHLISGDVARNDLGIHVQVTHATRDELAVLRAEIENQYG